MRRSILASPRTYVSLTALALVIGACLIPISTRITAPSLLQPEKFARVYPEEAGQIARIHVKSGDSVKQGDLLFEITSPAIAQERRLAEIRKELAETRLARIGAEAADLEQRGIIENEISALNELLAGYRRREAALQVRSPLDGRVADFNPRLKEGRWIARNELLAVLTGGEGSVARGYVAGDDLGRLREDARGLFVPDDLTQPKIAVTLREIAVSGAQAIDIPQLTSIANGPIAVEQNAARELVPSAAQYAILAIAENAAPTQTSRGVLLLDGKPESLASRAWRQVLKVLVREAGA